jgi:hypothetical protein
MSRPVLQVAGPTADVRRDTTTGAGSIAGARARTHSGSKTERRKRDGQVKFRVELVWTDHEASASSIFLTADGRIILQGRAVTPQERQALALPQDGEMISVDRSLIQAIKQML